MPPKKHEVQVVVEVPEQPPSIDGNPGLVDKLLAVVLTHPNDVAATVAAALHMDDYLINLQNGIVVDLWVELLVVCAQNKLKANKAMALLELVDAMRTSIVETQSCSEAKVMMKNFFVRHAGLAVKEKEQHAASIGAEGGANPIESMASAGVGADGKPVQNTGNSGAPSAGAGASTNIADTTAASGAKAKAALKKGKGVEEPPPPPKPTFDAGMQYLSLDDVHAVAPFITSGLLQHWQLYATVGSCKRTQLFVPTGEVEPAAFSFAVGIQTPMTSHSLQSAVTLEEDTKNHADEAAKAAAERAELQAREEANIASEKAALEAAAARRKAEEEEVRAGLLYLRKATAERAVDQLTTSIERELSERQRRIILRIQKLEGALQLATSTSNM